MKEKGDREMDYRLKAMHKRKSKEQKLKTDIRKYLEYMERFALTDINEEIELIRQIKEIEK